MGQETKKKPQSGQLISTQLLKLNIQNTNKPHRTTNKNKIHIKNIFKDSVFLADFFLSLVQHPVTATSRSQ